MTIEEERRDPGPDDAPDAGASEERSSDEVRARAETRDAEAREAALPAADDPLSAEAPAVDDPDSRTREPAGSEAEPGSGTPDEVSDPDTPAQAPGDQATAETSEALPSGPPPRERRGPREDEAAEQPEVVPGADLEPDLVLDEPSRAEAEDEYGVAAYAARYAEPETDEAPAEAQQSEEAQQAPAPRSPMELAADARYMATGKRKTSVARVILKPGTGTYTINGRALDDFFPRAGLQNTARQPLIAAGYEARMDVVARLHGGGVSSQAGALRHGVARALAEADPSLRGELKRRGYLTRDPRAKERKKAGLKKARKRPQFSKR